MAYNVLFTSLFAAGKDEPLRYYFANDGDRRVYTDAMLTVEAATRYVLSRKHIDELIILGRKLTYDEGDEGRVLGADDGKSFFSSDTRELSTYSLFRYRLAQFIDDLRIEQHEISDTLTPEEQNEVISFIRNFYNNTSKGDAHRKFNRFFDELIAEKGLYDRLRAELPEAIPAAAGKMGVYLSWIKNYLYMNLKDSAKMEILNGNEDGKVRFIPTVIGDDGIFPVDNILKVVDAIAKEHDKVDIYIALNNDDMTDNFVMFSVLDILDTLYGDNIEVKKVFTTTSAHYRLAGMVRDDTEGYGITELVAAARTFLRYGKVDMIVDYWEKNASKNEQIEKMIYAMKRIDIGLSLCTIKEIEKGISILRDLFANGFDLEGSDNCSRLFMLISEGIKTDYGSLLTSDEIEFLDLVKWAYERDFFQQCLTLIEARAPGDMVRKGIFYYCGSEDDKYHVTDVLARVRASMKKQEYWRMDDIDHFFIKDYYHNFEGSSRDKDRLRQGAQNLVELLDNCDEDKITALSSCEDRKLLEELIYAYQYAGRIRNEANHAADENDSEGLISNIKDVSVKLSKIREGIEYFIMCYEKMLDAIKDKEAKVVLITSFEVKSEAKKYETFRDDRYGTGSRKGR